MISKQRLDCIYPQQSCSKLRGLAPQHLGFAAQTDIACTPGPMSWESRFTARHDLRSAHAVTQALHLAVQ